MNDIKNTTVKPTIKKSIVYAYAFFGQGSFGFYLTFQAYYLMFYLTDILKIPVIAAAAVYSATQWIKVLTMISSGIVIDSTNLKWGKYRSWMQIGAVILFISFGTMFYNFGLAPAAGIALFLLLFTAQTFGYNLIWTGNRSLLGPMSKNSADAVFIAAGQSQVGTVIGMINGVVSVSVLAFFNAHFANGYSITGYVYTGWILLCITFGLMRITKPYEKYGAESAANGGKNTLNEKITLLQMIRSLKGPMIPYFFSMTLSSAKEGFFYALLAYFAKYVLNNPLVLGYSLTLQSVGGFFGALLIPYINSRFGKKKSYIIGMFVTCVLFIGMAFLGRTAVGFLIFRTLIGFVNSATGAFHAAFANDIAEYNEMKGSSAARGFIQSVAGTTIRFGGILSATISSFSLAALGYSSAAEPTAQIINGITTLLAAGPATVSALAGIIFIFYRVNEKELNEYRELKTKL